jgi:hypothetical protein
MTCNVTALYAQQDLETTFIPEGERPDGTVFLPEPPRLSDATFFDDFYYYQWGKSVRDTELGQLAIEHDAAELVDVYSDIIGIDITPEGTPEIYKLCQWLCNDIQKENHSHSQLLQAHTSIRAVQRAFCHSRER